MAFTKEDFLAEKPFAHKDFPTTKFKYDSATAVIARIGQGEPYPVGVLFRHWVEDRSFRYNPISICVTKPVTILFRDLEMCES